jgi:hypothetical protein
LAAWRTEYEAAEYSFKMTAIFGASAAAALAWPVPKSGYLAKTQLEKTRSSPFQAST